MRQWASLHGHSDNSLLDGLTKPKQLIKTAKDNGLYAVALSDHGVCSGAVELMKEGEKQDFKTIQAVEFYVGHENSKVNSHLVVLAKNLKGWKNLIKAVSRSNIPDKFYRRPRLFLEDFAEFADGLIAFSGHCGSDLANVVFKNPNLAYSSRSYDEAKNFVNVNWVKDMERLLCQYQEVFGKENMFLEGQRIDEENLPAAKLVYQAIKYMGKKTGCPIVATADSHYPTREAAKDQRVLLCTNLNTTLQEVERKLNNDEDFGMGGFFRSNNYHIPTLEEMNELHTEEELENSIKIADMCEDYNILNKPILPPFPCPNGLSQDEYLRELCKSGWNDKIKGVIPKEKHKEYGDRVKMELEVLQGAGLSSYFLIVQDYVNWAKSQGSLVGYARGSAGGCLISYLLNITGVDPIPYDLLFERFYNAGRNTKDRTSLPDVDIDFEIDFRSKVIQYVRGKYGNDKVAQMATFGRMMGRGVLKDVLRTNSVCSFDDMNKITEFIPDEAEISDQLQIMREDGEEAGIIRWALINNAKELSEWCTLKDDGTCEGQYAPYFEQAMRLEGTKRSQGKHAAGIVISSTPLADSVPMLYDKHNDELIAGFDMYSMEEIGIPKWDFLGTAILSKIKGVSNFLGMGDI